MLLIFLHLTGLSQKGEALLAGLVRPAALKIYAAGSYIRSDYYRQTDKRELESLVGQLEEQVNQLTVQNAQLKIVEDENETLRKYLNFWKQSKAAFVMADVISRDGSQLITLDKGSKDGLAQGLVLLDGDGTVVGKITGVKDDISQACLITNPRCKLAAMIQNGTKTDGVAEGELGLTVKMDLIPQTESIQPGDIVVTSGLENDIPRGLVIGKISKVDKENNELWQDATIDPLVNFNDLHIVSIIK